MPQIQRASMSGCCVGTYYYDLGGAHSKYRSKNIEEFALRILELGMNKINTASTNSQQGPERKFLEELGFKEVFTHGGMHVHAVDNITLEKHLAPFKAIKQKKYEEEQAKKRAAEAERLKKAQEAEAIRKKAQEEAAKKLLDGTAKVESNEDVNITWVRKQYALYPGVPLHTLFNTLFGFKKFPEGYERKWDDESVLRSINSRLKKRREDAKKG